jgi:hypothetical protein
MPGFRDPECIQTFFSDFGPDPAALHAEATSTTPVSLSKTTRSAFLRANCFETEPAGVIHRLKGSSTHLYVVQQHYACPLLAGWDLSARVAHDLMFLVRESAADF